MEILSTVLVLLFFCALQYFYFKKYYRKKFRSQSEFRLGFFFSLFDDDNNDFIYARLQTDQERNMYRRQFVVNSCIIAVIVIVACLFPLVFFLPQFTWFKNYIVELVGISMLFCTILALFLSYRIINIQKLDRKLVNEFKAKQEVGQN